MRIATLAAAAGLLSVLAPAPLHAGSLEIAPVSIEVISPGAGSTIKLHNEGNTRINAQIRVFRWTQKDGEDKLEPTENVVASPPMARLGPGADYTVRIVRLSKQPVGSEESYRLLIDELPDQRPASNQVVNLILRYSIPVFFVPPNAAPAKLNWSVAKQQNHIQVSAINEGDRHVRLAALNLRDAQGKTLSFGAGLTGYVLGRSRMQWATPAKEHALAVDASLQISAVGDTGPIHASPAARPLH